MARIPGRIGTLRARDIMTKKVIVLTASEPIASAILTLKEQRITGAPVVDEEMKLIGMISISDLLQPPPNGDPDSDPDRERRFQSDESLAWELLESGMPFQHESSEPIQTRMTKHVTAVREDARLVEVARLMCRGHWHRVPVIDDARQLCGIISTMDILAAIVHAEDE